MPKYLFEATYVGEGVEGLLREGGTARRAAIERGVQSVGGTLEAFYFAFGDTDAFVIADVPDNVAASALSLMVTASGVATVKTVVLLTPEEVDEVVKQRPAYRPPGK